MTVSAAIIDRLKKAVDAAGASTDPDEIAPRLKEWRQRWTGHTPLLLKPADTAAVARILGICHETGTPIVPQGGNTGLVGGQIPTRGEVLLSLERMNRIRAVNAADNTLVAEAGAVLGDVQKAASNVDRLFPLSLAAEGSCTIGGNIATNAGGINVLRYGMMRELVLGIEVVLDDGSVLELMRGLRKDNTGYDLKQLFIGAEGTLGIVTAAMLKLFPKPAGYAVAYAAISEIGAAVEILNRIQGATGNLVTAFEILPRFGLDLVLKHIPATQDPLPAHRGWTVLIEVSLPSVFDATPVLEEALAGAMEDGLVLDAVFAKNERDRKALWRLRETMPEAQRAEGASISNDVAVRLADIPELIANTEAAVKTILPGVRPFAFGHVGDGNLHLTIQAPVGGDSELLATRTAIEEAVMGEVERLKGSISAEHGLGLARNAAIARYKSEAEIALMRTLKDALDPKGILNPGKVVPPL
jgi:FAD/FMN-containing dehydrogenase